MIATHVVALLKPCQPRRGKHGWKKEAGGPILYFSNDIVRRVISPLIFVIPAMFLG
jgi:hypothetical protein